MENEQKKDKTGIYTAIIAGVVTLSTAVIANVDKITGKSDTEEKKEVVADTVSFSYKLEKVIKDCPNDFSNTIGNIREEDGQDKNYYSKTNFDEGLTTVSFSGSEKPNFNIAIYNGSDKNLAYQKKLDIYKKVGDALKTKAVATEKTEDGYQQLINTFEKGNIEISILDGIPTDDPKGDEVIYLTIEKK